MIEAATENQDLKLKILKHAELAKKGDHRDQHVVDFDYPARRCDVASRKLIGMHFFNPVPMMTLVELIRGLQTSEATIALSAAFAKSIGKAPIR